MSWCRDGGTGRHNGLKIRCSRRSVRVRLPLPAPERTILAKIRLLKDHVINLISAGEVVERPASVAKELLENSLDAGAQNIVTELDRGGRKRVTVRDDGHGMSRHDLLLSVQRHATSKLSEASDLGSIDTLGFRGEALPSIAAVSHMTITTSDGEDGWTLRIDGGSLRDVEPAARTTGTTVTVGSLFFNQPARRKFLRAEATELSWVERFVTGCAFASPETGFILTHNDRELFQLSPGQSIEDRVFARYGFPRDSRLITVDGSTDQVHVRLLCMPEQRWNSRRHQYVLVNGRLVYTRAAQGPIDRHLAGPAGFPFCICCITLPASRVDVNMHPAKREVRFSKPRDVEQAVEDALSGIPSVRKEAVSMAFSSITPPGQGGSSFSTLSEPASLFPLAMELQAGSAIRTDVSSGSPEGVPIVQIARSYLVSATDSGLVVVDQHAAHERILFEEVLNGAKLGALAGQQRLLIPESIRLDQEALEMLRVFEAVIRETGFDYSLEDDTLLLHAVPSGVRHGIDAIREVLLSFDDPARAELPQREQIAAATACAGSIKFGDALSTDEARELLDRLFATSDPFHCPHGRPTLIEIPFSELERRFGRL